eukprot:TRINITY_DN33997_c0_g1_i1.p1 TRINITY_DN33997_c0_g1~~TRINITY_DN33997_c0_g1_i1.p1  ORF type:complete len:276 (+),score=33.42 TRINITY_DN33997_c0_g1_i1:58-885(+)
MLRRTAIFRVACTAAPGRPLPYAHADDIASPIDPFDRADQPAVPPPSPRPDDPFYTMCWANSSRRRGAKLASPKLSSPLTRVSAPRLGIWAQETKQMAWNPGGNASTDRQTTSFKWWEFPGFDYMEWQRQHMKKEADAGAPFFTDSLVGHPALRHRWQPKHKGPTYRTFIFWMIIVGSCAGYSYARHRKYWYDLMDESARFQNVGLLIYDAERLMHAFLRQQIKDLTFGYLAGRSPLLRDYSFFHNKEVQLLPGTECVTYEWWYTFNMPTLNRSF